MKKQEFQDLLASTFDTMHQLTATKGEEYARDTDQLANFKRGAADAGTSPLVVWVIFFNKHIDAIKSYVREGKTFSEHICGRIDDAILYLILLKAIVIEQQRGTMTRCAACAGSGHKHAADPEKPNSGLQLVKCELCNGEGKV